jgi:hypothetical protein
MAKQTPEDEALAPYTAVVEDISIYVQPEGCIELTVLDDDVEDEDMVHICEGMWDRVCTRVDEIRARRLLQQTQHAFVKGDTHGQADG